MIPARRTRTAAVGTALLVVITACAGEDTPDEAAPSPTATAAAPSPSPTPEPSPEPSRHANLRALLEDYEASDEWVVETVIRGVDAGTGGLAVAPDGTIFQADFGAPGEPGDRVLRITPDGEVSVFAQSEDFGSLTMSVFGPDGRLYQSSYGTNKVFVFEEDGTPTLLADDIEGATGLVILDDGTVYAEAYNASRIYRIDPDGTVEVFADDILLNGPNGMSQTPDGTLYAINHRDGGLNRVDADGTVTRIHTFPRPTSHIVHLDGKLYITSRGSYVVFEFDPATDEARIIAGAGVLGDQDGRGIDAAFGRPNAITVGPDGHLYINHRTESEIAPLTIRRLVRRPVDG